jgi:hypothetical protein
MNAQILGASKLEPKDRSLNLEAVIISLSIGIPGYLYEHLGSPNEEIELRCTSEPQLRRLSGQF